MKAHTAFYPETALSPVSGNKQKAVSGSYAWFYLCFSVGTLEDTTKRSASFSSYKTSVYCVFRQIS